MTSVMIDIETLDTKPNSTILTVGGVKFDPCDDREPWDAVYHRLDLDEQSQLGRTTSEDTLAWWARQDQAIRDEAFSDRDRISLADFFKDFNRWLVGADTVWCHTTHFDITILETLARDLGVPVNWSFYQIRDTRTVYAMLPRDPRKDIQQDAHNALADSYYQALALQEAYRQLNLNQDQQQK